MGNGQGQRAARRAGRGAEFTIAPMDDDLTTPSAAATARIRIVLVGTQHPGNIGSAARAIKTMGLSRLVLVAPERFPDAQADALAAGADDILQAASLHQTLAEAVADCRLVLGCTARSRRVPLPEQLPRDAALRLVDAAGTGAEVALVFGRERTGLDNDELQQCHGAVHIPSDPGYSSLNLAAAVQVLAYEVRLALLQASAGTGEGMDAGARAGAAAGAGALARETEAGHGPLATHAELEGLFSHLADTLEAIDFHKGRAPQSAMRKLRRLFLRGDLDQHEVRLLRGILADAQRMARLANERGPPLS